MLLTGIREVGCRAFAMRESFPAAAEPATVPKLTDSAPLPVIVSPEALGTLTPPRLLVPAGGSVKPPRTVQEAGDVQP